LQAIVTTPVLTGMETLIEDDQFIVNYALYFKFLVVATNINSKY